MAGDTLVVAADAIGMRLANVVAGEIVGDIELGAGSAKVGRMFDDIELGAKLVAEKILDNVKVGDRSAEALVGKMLNEIELRARLVARKMLDDVELWARSAKAVEREMLDDIEFEVGSILVLAMLILGKLKLVVSSTP
ncbi:hypothetical protein MMC21_002679 [Puttea exsequens]|nr:hypothetical protein [Puttea exsequens]